VHGQWPDIVTHGCRIEQPCTPHLVSAHGTRTSETQLTGRIVPDVIAAPGDDNLAIVAIDALRDRFLDHLIHPCKARPLSAYTPRPRATSLSSPPSK
jgi:hypothetical protein